MSFAYDGGQKVHGGGGATRRDDTPRDWTPDERAAHAKNTASNVTRAAAEVAAACARMRAATEFTEQAAAKKEAGLALQSLRAAATAAAAAVSQATDPEVVVVLQGADAQLKAADAEVKALPEPIATSPREVTGVRRFATALPPADGPGRQDSPRMVAQLRGIIASELVHGDLDPLKAALAEGGELWPQFSRLAMQLRADLLAKLDTERPRLLTERIDREMAAKRRSVGSVPVEAVADPAAPAHDGPAAANSPGADVHDPLHALAATASAQLGIAPRLEVGEAGRAATEARGARGVAHGDAIAIHPDVDPATPAGKQVVFHEHLHQAQSQLPAEQDAGRAAAELEADELASAAAGGGALTRPTRHIDLSRPAGDDDAKRARDQGPHSEAAEARVDAALAAAARDGQTVTSRVYLRGHLSERVLPAITRFLADKRYPLPERLRYVDSDRAIGAEAVRLITEVHGSDPFYALPQILERVGVDVWAIIDAHRKAPAPRTFGDVVGGAAPTDSTDLSAGQRGGPGWVDGIGTGIAAGFHRAVSESVTRLGERYVAAFDSNGKDAAESHGLRKDLAVAYHHLSPVVAIDRLVGRVMVDDLVRVDPAPAAKPAPAKDKPADAPTAAQPTVTSAAQRVAENAGQVDMALGLNRRGPGGLHMPPKEIHALRHSLDDLADTLHDHARQDRDEVKELDVARAKVEAVQRQLVGRYGARNAEVTSLAKAVGRVWAAARANQATDTADTQDERDGLASVARETLAMLEGARSMIEQAQGQVPGVYVFSKPIMPAITTTRQWVTELDGGQDAAAATRLATAIRIQEQFVATVVAELTAVFAEPPTATWAATVNAYAEVLGQSSQSPDHSAPALEQARRMRRRLKLDVAAAFIDGGNEAAGQVRDLDSKEGAAATAEQRALMARREQYEEQIAAGGVVSQAALDDLALDAREQAFDHRLEVLDQMAKKVRGAAADLQEGHYTRGLAVWAVQKQLLAGVVPKCDALVRSLAEVERTTLAARTKAGKAASPDKGNALRTAAADAAEVQLKAALRDGHYQATLDEARSKLDDAQLVDTIAMLAELIAMTLVGNMAATATSGMARGMVLARASANAERAAAAMEAAGTARQLALAEQAGTMVRAESLAARIGGAAGMAAEGVVNSLGQKYLQGDDSSLASLIVVNIGTSVALERLVGALTTVRKAEQAGEDAVAEVRKLRLAARKSGAMAKAALTLGAEAVMAAAVDHALSKMVGRASNPPTDQTVAEWLMQGAMMAVGKHMSRNVDAIAHSLETLDLKATDAGADIYARAKTLATRSHELAAGEGAGHSTDVLEHYIQLLSDQTRLLNQEMVEAVDHSDDKRRAQIVKALRDANRASGQVRDFANDSIEGATTEPPKARQPAGSSPDGAEPKRARGDEPAAAEPPRTRVPAAPDRAPTEADPARTAPAEGAAEPAAPAELPVHERPTGKMEAVAPPPDVAAEADVAVAPRKPPESLPALQRIESVTGVTKGPQYEQGMAELRQFYAEMEAEAQHRTPVRNTRKDGGYEWDYGHDSRTFSHGLVNVEFRVHLVRGRGVGDPEIAKLQASVHAGVDKHYNLPDNQVTPRGGEAHRLHVEVVFVDDPAQAHIVVLAKAGNDRAYQNEWYVDGDPTTHAHEVGHGAFGLRDEYFDPSGQGPGRAWPNSPGVATDRSLMGDYFERDTTGQVTGIQDGVGVRERHLDEIGAQVSPTTNSPTAEQRLGSRGTSERRTNGAPRAPEYVTIRGFAQGPRLSWARNPDGVTRTPAEAVALARAHGVEIPDDILVRVTPPKFMPPNARAAYLERFVTDPAGRVTWDDFYAKGLDEILVRVEPTVFESDEAIVALLAHEMHELNNLRRIFEESGGSMTLKRLHDLVSPGIKGNLHDQAWDVADAAVAKMRKDRGQ
ncbi:MAG: hypothetical protein JNK64_13030 [Myxococcales bacterium]|nr:hypothetical protein [Myxococcales bacterium]